MAISVFDIYKVGVGPSSSHTFGPMVAAERFLKELEAENLFDRTAKAQVELYSSMSLTGKGHFTDLASMLGLEGNAPATLDSATIPAKQKRIETEKTLNLGGKKMVPFDPETGHQVVRRQELRDPSERDRVRRARQGRKGDQARALLFDRRRIRDLRERVDASEAGGRRQEEAFPIHDRGRTRRAVQEGRQVDRADRLSERADMADSTGNQEAAPRDRGGDGEIHRDRPRRPRERFPAGHSSGTRKRSGTR